jgi:tellurite resistance protein TehA-like permease
LLEVKPPPDVFAAVMATGIVSIAAADHAVETSVPAFRTVSLVFFWVAFAVWLIVACAGLLRSLRFVESRPR